MQLDYWKEQEGKSAYGLSAIDLKLIRRKLGETNLRRMQVFTVLTFFIQILLMLAIDMPSIRRAQVGGIGFGAGEPVQLPLAYLLLHLLLALTMIAGYVVTVRFAKHIQQEDEARLRRFEVLFFATGETALVLLAAIAALDQFRSGDISTFALNCLLVAAFTYIVPPMNLFLFIPPFLVFMVGIAAFQQNVTMKTTYMINASAFFVTMMVLSTILFKGHMKQLADERLLESANRKLDELALKDQLTGLANRRFFSIFFEREAGRLRREEGSAYLAVLDIDHFKEINDRFGHPIGDQVLSDIGWTLNSKMRDSDLAARWGGEEFIVFLPDVNAQIAGQIMERIRADIEQRQVETEKAVVQYTVSIGLGKVNPKVENPLHEAYTRADNAMYKAKIQGRNRLIFDDGIE